MAMGIVSYAEGYAGILVSMVDGTTTTISFDENPVIKLQPEKLIVKTDVATTEFDRLAVSRFNYLSGQSSEETANAQGVDLGLPSGTIWAEWNVGASSPEEYGGYYAWGEVEEKSDYTDLNYKFWADKDGNGYWSFGEYANIGSNISGSKYDVAHQKWGGSWRMPTKAEFEELMSNCSWTWSQYKGVNGYKITASNGNSIFLPAAGYRWKTLLDYDGRRGSYWSATVHEDSSYYGAWDLLFENSFYKNYDNYYRFYAHSVRPVMTGEDNSVEKTWQNEVEVVNKGGVLSFANLPADSEIKLYSVDGKLLKSEVVTDNYSIIITNLTNGVYIVNVNGVSTKIAK